MKAGAQPHGEIAAGEMPLFIAREVIDQAMEMSQRAGDVEVGGVLVGRLRHDASVPEIFVEVTGLIPAQHTLASATKVTFTPETWAAVDAAIALRRRNEVKAGWAHFHPMFCRQCSADRRANCIFNKPFFSDEDCHLHRVCFSRAHHVALLVSDTPAEGMVITTYGWSKGMMKERGFWAAPGASHVDRSPLGRSDTTTNENDSCATSPCPQARQETP
jgi:proteasome lid subunit RPN8/RPN11